MGFNTLFILAVTTSQMIMPGMPNMAGMPGGMQIPGMGGAAYTLQMDLYSDYQVNKSSKAECAIPEGLKLGPKVDLSIYLPVKVEDSVNEDGENVTNQQDGKLVMKYYWMCAEKVPAGQPKIIDMDKMIKPGTDNEAKLKAMEKAAKEANKIAERSHAYWPKPGENPIKNNSHHCPGPYKLTTNYCGGTSVTLDKSQDFLAPVDLVSPGKKPISLDETIVIDWKPVPNAQAYILSAFGTNSQNEMIMWTSSGDPEIMVDFATKAMTPDEVKKYIDKGILLPPDKTSCRIPAGIFKGCQAPMLTVTAVGTDKIQKKDDIETNVIVRSTATVMLAEGMGGMDMDMEINEDISDEKADEPAKPAKSTVKKSSKKTKVEDEEPAEEPKGEDSDSGDDGNAIDDANEGMDKADKVKDAVNRAKDLFRW